MPIIKLSSLIPKATLLYSAAWSPNFMETWSAGSLLALPVGGAKKELKRLEVTWFCFCCCCCCSDCHTVKILHAGKKSSSWKRLGLVYSLFSTWMSGLFCCPPNYCCQPPDTFSEVCVPPIKLFFSFSKLKLLTFPFVLAALGMIVFSVAAGYHNVLLFFSACWLMALY